MANTTTQDVLSRAQSALSASPVYLLRQLDVTHVDGAIYLSGQVDSFYHKQLAQEVVRAVSGSHRVVNSVRVE
ncbi:MAG: BON domain-containing protein [Pirellulaceae bacterium]